MARLAAHDLLVEVREDNAYANLVWPAILEHRGISDRDAAFATELGYGTLRWLGRHDVFLSACVDRDLASLHPGLLDALRLGVHQLHNMRVPPHAAVSETVTLVREVVNPGAARMANAVLRKLAAGGSASDWLRALSASGAIPSDPSAPGYRAVAWSHPQWIVAGLDDALAGSASWPADRRDRAQPEGGTGELDELLLADNTPAGITLACRSVQREELISSLADRGIAATAGSLSRLAVRVGAVNPARLAEVATGRVGVQDEGSQLVALALCDAPLIGSDRRWLDMCAGPGGKAAILAGQVADRGGRLTAIELHEHRAQLVRQTLRTVRGSHEVRCDDALHVDVGTDYDRILLDVPCTGLGALRRRPELRWRRTADDLRDLVQLQRRLLERAMSLVRPGGLILYATCSPLRAETVDVVSRAIEGSSGAFATVEVPGPKSVRDGDYLRTWPHRHGTDGMFAALLQRTSQ